MSFWGKTAKITSIAMMVGGGIVCAGSIAQLVIAKTPATYNNDNKLGNDLLVSGCVLFSVSTLVVYIGIILFLLNIRKTKR